MCHKQSEILLEKGLINPASSERVAVQYRGFFQNVKDPRKPS